MGRQWPVAAGTIQGDDLCIDLPEPDGGCFEVSGAGQNVVLIPK